MARIFELDRLEFASLIRPGSLVCWGQGPAEPLALTRALMAQRASIGGFRAFVGMSWADTVDVEHTDHVRFISYCAAGANRKLAAAGKLDVLPVHYSTLADFLGRSVDVLMLQLSAAADGGYGLSVACEYLAPLIPLARLIIAEVNAQAPQTRCDIRIHADEIDVLIHTDRPLPHARNPPPGEVEAAIASRVAGYVEDGAVLQVGLGTLPDRVARELSGRRDLGIHSGLISDGLGYLIQRGAVTNARKRDAAGVSIAGLLAGGAGLMNLASRNPEIELRSTVYTHSLNVLAGIERFTAINSAIEVDLTGQVNAEAVAGRYVGAVGGAMDFLRGAALAPKGLPIIVLPSTANGGAVSRIVARLDGPVSTPRADVGLIVTEHGIADLRGLSIRQRQRRMVELAAPAFREALEREASVGPSKRKEDCAVL
ncbi:acyl-CoA hydrolase [Azorhizobium sp. AG788]|uniref:acetyl-CoA hydrolase/transferase family protein n=1 Tax=Azorhizobium sp. AG788 TaxID=2183897 RepID=UPI00106069F5|nr:acetyl-CoA hydrolase/transferase C-terminal domain-containing protein [Azorhizobium sp. AG788]TDU00870.1 acyl-CoA hydrolase [Azorhizobium sp. AG788]